MTSNQGPLSVMKIFIFQRYDCVNSLFFYYDELQSEFDYESHKKSLFGKIGDDNTNSFVIFKRDDEMDACQNYAVDYDVSPNLPISLAVY